MEWAVKFTAVNCIRKVKSVLQKKNSIDLRARQFGTCLKCGIYLICLIYLIFLIYLIYLKCFTCLTFPKFLFDAFSRAR